MGTNSRDYMREYYEENKVRIRENQKRYEAKVKEKRQAYLKAYRDSHKEETHLYYISHRNKMSQQNKRWKQSHVLASRVYYENNKDLILERTKEWRQQNKDRVKAYDERYNLENWDKRSAEIVARILPLQDHCELCPEDDVRTEGLEKHHPDYNYPLIVVTACRDCHNNIHKREVKIVCLN